MTQGSGIARLTELRERHALAKSHAERCLKATRGAIEGLDGFSQLKADATSLNGKFFGLTFDLRCCWIPSTGDCMLELQVDKGQQVLLAKISASGDALVPKVDREKTAWQQLEGTYADAVLGALVDAVEGQQVAINLE